MTALSPISFVESIVKTALAEDIGGGDITTALTIPRESIATGVIVAREQGVLCGLDVVRATFDAVDPEIVLEEIADDGSRLSAGDTIATLSGRTRGILSGERVALNFLQRMSGIATATARYVESVSHTKARIVDTRKTTPGLRVLEKYAVRVGGGFNHRFGLSDGVLIKDNHLAAAGGVATAVSAAKKQAPHTLRIEVEVGSLNQLDEAVEAGADAVLLDNMTPDVMREAVELVGGTVILEASGGVSEENVVEIAETGVDIISVGALTHSVRALDISLDLKPGS